MTGVGFGAVWTERMGPKSDGLLADGVADAPVTAGSVGTSFKGGMDCHSSGSGAAWLWAPTGISAIG